MRPRRLLLFLLPLLVLATGAAAAPRRVVPDGGGYVELTRAAAQLKLKVDATAAGTQARLRAGDRVVTLTRNWARVLVDGDPLVLDAPVRVKHGVWLVPSAFVARVGAKLAASARRAPTRGAVEPIALQELRMRSYPSFTRIVVETATPLEYRVEASTPRERRVRLVRLAAEPRVEAISDGFVAEARLERAGADALLRVAFEGSQGDVRASALADPPRVVLDFLRPDAPSAREVTAQPPLRTVVLDAGHGGHDSGAIGPGGLMEKDLALDVTRRVAKLAEDTLGVTVLLTRDGDHFVPLRDRTTLANRERGDLFVSIHANAHRQAASEGVETYILSSEATDGAARQAAATENAVVQLARANGRGRDVVKTILWDLAQSEYQIASSRLAEMVLDSLTRALRIPNRGVKQAGFYVLGGAAMPAVLVEIGFVTNPREERRLRDPRYRDEIARAIVAGLAEYKRQVDQRTRAAIAPARAAD